jgi:hypothetical protein
MEWRHPGKAEFLPVEMISVLSEMDVAQSLAQFRLSTAAILSDSAFATLSSCQLRILTAFAVERKICDFVRIFARELNRPTHYRPRIHP